MGGVGSGGTNKISDEEKKLRGTFQPCRSHEKRRGTPEKEAPPGKPPPPPRALSPQSKRLWKRVVSDYDFAGDVNGQTLLHKALKAHDQALEARKLIEQEGMVIENPRTGQRYENPATKILRTADQAFLRFWRALGLKWVGDD